MDGGLIRWGVESLFGVFKGRRNRQVPLYRQAQRLLDAFQAHGVPPHQLPRLMPEAIRLKPQDVTSSDALTGQLQIAHLDWASETLALRRDWFDLETGQPHQEVRAYKQPAMLHDWLEAREEIRGGRFGSIHVLTEAPFKDPGAAHGRFLVVYAEDFAEIDDKSLCRYWYLSNGSHFEHPACVIDLLGILTIAEHFSLTSFARAVSSATLLAAEGGKLGLLPLELTNGEGWRIQDWVPVQYQSANCLSETHAAYWEKAKENLMTHSLGRVLDLSSRRP